MSECECNECMLTRTVDKLRECVRDQSKSIVSLRDQVIALQEALERAEDWAEDSDDEAECRRALLRTLAMEDERGQAN